VTDAERIAKALEFPNQYGYIDGAHHKQWVIDQMVRALTGCPMVSRRGVDINGVEYNYEVQGESAEYLEWVGEPDDDFEGWDVGIAP
jgi:hypothetical protein